MGAPWMIELPLSGLMTVGFDVCHSSKNKNKSYGALVATMDIRLSTRYYSSVTEHMKGQELSNQMSLSMTCALKAYREHHGTLPERILFYRDGVGEGQLHQVFNTEVKLLKDQLDKIYKSAGKEEGCRLGFVVVAKRINTRYFVNRRNPEPGTVVDDIITLPEYYDFYLVSQAVNQGTVTPTHYNVIHDNMGLDADKIQLLTFKLTHLYYNWSGTLRVPAVCQYAHKLAFLIAESIHRAPSSGLENQLYFCNVLCYFNCISDIYLTYTYYLFWPTIARLWVIWRTEPNKYILFSIHLLFVRIVYLQRFELKKYCILLAITELISLDSRM